MANQFTETTHTGIFSHLGSSIKGVFTGLLLILGGIVLLWTNEGRAVKTARALEEGSENVISIKADKVVDANNKKLVHVSGLATTTDTIYDNDFKIKANALKIIRSVEHYQWKETSNSVTEKNIGGSTDTKTTYEYTKGWEASPIESSEFKLPQEHENINPYTYNDEVIIAKNITLGAFTLPENLVNRISKSEKLMPSVLDSIQSKTAIINSNYIYVGSKNISSPKIGDLRISYSVIYPKQISIVATQIDNTFEEYIASNDKEVELLQEGTVSAEKMFKSAIEGNNFKTKLFRFLGFLLIFIGLRGIFKPLVVVANIVPFVGSILSTGVGIACFAVALPLSLLIIALAWLAYRPMVAGILVASAIVIILLLKQRGNKKKTITKA
ncbi:MAG: TMEM43 family protein [Bacteroidota bacterium]|nr:TMEM43 family protein [Bacteroidota bacterium]